MPEGLGEGLAGFAKGFGQVFLRRRMQQHEEELGKEAQQYQLFKDALHTAAQRGDTPAIAHIFRSMEEFSAESGKGKKGRQKQQGILSKFAEMLQGNPPSQEAQAATSRQQQEATGGVFGTPNETALKGESRPRIAGEGGEPVRKPLLMSNRELAEEELSIKEAEAKRLLPIRLQEEEAKSKFLMQRQIEVHKADINARLDAKLSEMEAGDKLKANQRIRALTAATGDEGKAKELYLDEIEAGIHQKEASAKLSETRASYVAKNYELAKNRYDETVRHHKELEARAREASARGNKSLENRIASSGSKELIASMSADLQQMSRVQSEINRLEGIVTNQLIDPKERENYKNNLADLDKQYTELRETIRRKQERLDGIGNDLEKRRLSGSSDVKITNPPKKSLLKSKGDNDPLGLYP